ncbi:FimV/HubP family polar landmark protein [Pseudomonas lutea]|uniref:Peptidoglycan-binding protein n=1 Tax=Pseudomonas lutea TaxID=243924 RepID=A0A9X0EHP5_9PSED|nr:FimV/HubP family polar landmark protein [Pseudomonas lutea]KGF66096.1 peptidoglycan-binding protein [Pseudomonas lutea]
MVQVRKLVLAIAAASALSSGMAQALGLGGLTVKSTLNQPLLAEIELTEVQDLSASQVVPSLATSAEFAQAGVGRVAILDDLTFTPVVNPGGKSVLRITSTKPIRDPYVKFLVQVLWPNGRALREYSLLLDPPKFSPQAAAAAAAGSAQLPSTAPNAAPATAPAAEAPAPAPAPSTPAPAPEPKFTQYTTANNDTLWEIAERVKNGGTVQQTMLAIQALNPDAFIAGNINRLKKGQVLRLPSPQESTALAQPRAVAEVAEQNRAWREGRRLPSGARQVDATRRDRTGPSPSQIDAKDSLSLVSANAKPGAKGAASDNADVSTQLATTQESLDSTRRDNAELKSRMTDLQSQVDKLQRLIQLKNDQLAKMQASGAAIPPPVDPANAANPANPAVSPNSVTNPNNAANPAMQAEVVPNAAAPDAAGKAPNEIAPEDALPVDGAAVTSATPDQPLIVPAEPVVDEDNRSALDKILSSPMLMGIIGGGALLVLLLLLLLLARRRNALIEAEKHRQMARALSEESDFASDMDMPPSSFEGLETPAPHAKMPPAPTVTEPVREHPADALVQAEIHIAYGRTNQAVAVLEDAIKHEPERSDLRLKLMEVYAEQDNTAGFVAQERQLIATGKNHAEVEELKSRYPSMAAAAAAVAGVAAAAVLASEMDAKYVEDLLHDEPEVAAQPQPHTEVPLDEEFDNAFDLSLDDLDGESTPTASNRAVAQEDATLDDLDLDAPFAGSAADDLDFDAILREQQAVSTDAKPADLDDFDLDLSEDQPALKAEDDYLLGMEDDLRDPSPAVPSAEPGATKADAADDIDLPADFDLSLADEMETDQASQAFASEIDDVNAELDRLSQSLEQPPIAKPFDAPPVDSPRFNEQDALLADDEPEFDFLSGTDEAATKLDLARAYIEMGDADGARDILDEVVVEGDDGQKTEARDMLSRLV